MFIDQLPIWGFIGKVERIPAGGKDGEEKEKLSLFTHIHFDVLYNKDHVIQVDISTGGCPGAGAARAQLQRPSRLHPGCCCWRE